MPNLSGFRLLQFVNRSAANLALKRVLAMSLEVTHSCNCHCKHCDKGGLIPDELLAPPQRFGELVRQLKPVVAQISGGEPLLRKDIIEIIKAVKPGNGLPYLVFVTNARLLTEEKYVMLKEAGVDEFSISLDYPDERHDENREAPGLYRHLNRLLPRLAAYGNRDITLISVIRDDNLKDLPALAGHALKWNVMINFSSYTPLRTQDRSKSVQAEKLKFLREQIDYLIDFKRKTGRIFTTESTLNQYYEFFANGSFIPNCRAGIRSLVVNPDGRVAPCAMGCLVSLRANTEKSVGTLLKDGWLSLEQMRFNARNSWQSS